MASTLQFGYKSGYNGMRNKGYDTGYEEILYIVLASGCCVLVI